MWSPSVKKFWLHFFEVYKKHTCLWDVDSVEYSDKIKKKEAYDELIRLARKVNPNADHDFIRARINNVRTAYRKEVKKVLVARENGRVYTPKLFYFDLLNSFLNHDNNLNLDLSFKESYCYAIDEDEGDPFGTLEAPVENDDSQESENVSVDDTKLNEEGITDQFFQNDFEAIEYGKPKDYVQVPNNVKNVSSKHDSNYNNDVALSNFIQDGADQSPCVLYHRKVQRPLKRDRKYFKDHKDAINVVESSEVAEQRAKTEKRPKYVHDDECDILGKRLATHFRNMRPQQRLFAEKIISDVCIYARMDQLTLRSGLMIELPASYSNFGQRTIESNTGEEVINEGVELIPDAYIEAL